MFSNYKTAIFSDNIRRLRDELSAADAVMIGAGAGISASAGLRYDGERFQRYFADFIAKYGFKDMYTGGFYNFSAPEEFWAWWSRHIWYNRYDAPTDGTYERLLSIVNGKDYFILTTNVDHQFQKAGFDKNRLFYTQGDYGLWQCSVPCHQKTYDNESVVRRMVAEQKDMRVPARLIPYCPVCGKPMVMNLRSDEKFVEDEGWNAAFERYSKFVRKVEDMHVLFLELGVGENTPGIIKYPFWQSTYDDPLAKYACVNIGDVSVPQEIDDRSICIQADISEVIRQLSCGR